MLSWAMPSASHSGTRRIEPAGLQVLQHTPQSWGEARDYSQALTSSGPSSTNSLRGTEARAPLG